MILRDLAFFSNCSHIERKIVKNRLVDAKQPRAESCSGDFDNQFSVGLSRTWMLSTLFLHVQCEPL